MQPHARGVQGQACDCEHSCHTPVTAGTAPTSSLDCGRMRHGCVWVCSTAPRRRSAPHSPSLDAQNCCCCGVHGAPSNTTTCSSSSSKLLADPRHRTRVVVSCLARQGRGSNRPMTMRKKLVAAAISLTWRCHAVSHHSCSTHRIAQDSQTHHRQCPQLTSSPHGCREVCAQEPAPNARSIAPTHSGHRFGCVGAVDAPRWPAGGAHAGEFPRPVPLEVSCGSGLGLRQPAAHCCMHDGRRALGPAARGQRQRHASLWDLGEPIVAH
jgi:hypothetical protein